jgi:hypothetical protein
MCVPLVGFLGLEYFMVFSLFFRVRIFHGNSNVYGYVCASFICMQCVCNGYVVIAMCWCLWIFHGYDSNVYGDFTVRVCFVSFIMPLLPPNC